MFVKGGDAVILHTVQAQHIQLTVNVYVYLYTTFCDSWSMKVYSLFQPDKNMERERIQLKMGEKMGFPKKSPGTLVSLLNLHNYLCVCVRVNVPVCIFVYMCLYWMFVQSPTKKNRWCTSTNFRTFSLAPSTGLEVWLQAPYVPLARTMRTNTGL